jgi:tyrosyl-tRNA synthetase
VKRDIIRKRLETPDESISYTEFAYSLLQGFDYLMLHKKYGCDLQVGGSDQWTNILSGVELIRRKEGKESFALTWPLVTDASGKKFGKSEGNAMWLDPKKTSPFAFYQFFINQPDEEVEKLLNMFTLLPKADIEALMETHKKAPQDREAQETLARLVTEIVHGPAATAAAAAATDALFGGRSLSELTREERTTLINGTLSLPVSRGAVADGHLIADILVGTKLASSKAEARRLIEGKGVSIAGKVVESPDQKLSEKDFENGLALLKKGKRETLVLVLK